MRECVFFELQKYDSFRDAKLKLAYLCNEREQIFHHRPSVFEQFSYNMPNIANLSSFRTLHAALHVNATVIVITIARWMFANHTRSISRPCMAANISKLQLQGRVIFWYVRYADRTVLCQPVQWWKEFSCM